MSRSSYRADVAADEVSSLRVGLSFRVSVRTG
jgi:hypothetical protein